MRLGKLVARGEVVERADTEPRVVEPVRSAPAPVAGKQTAQAPDRRPAPVAAAPD